MESAGWLIMRPPQATGPSPGVLFCSRSIAPGDQPHTIPLRDGVEIANRFLEPGPWWRSAILNIAHMGWFSSDRAIREYAEEIWNVPIGKA